jgi:hypothetical protein
VAVPRLSSPWVTDAMLPKTCTRLYKTSKPYW